MIYFFGFIDNIFKNGINYFCCHMRGPEILLFNCLWDIHDRQLNRRILFLTTMNEIISVVLIVEVEKASPRRRGRGVPVRSVNLCVRQVDLSPALLARVILECFLQECEPSVCVIGLCQAPTVNLDSEYESLQLHHQSCKLPSCQVLYNT